MDDLHEDDAQEQRDGAGRLPEGLKHHFIEVGPVQQRELGVRHVTAIHGPLLHHGEVLPPAQVTVTFRIRASGLTGELAYQVIDGRRVLRMITRLQNDRRPELSMSDMRSLPITEIEADIDQVMDWFRSDEQHRFRQSFERFADSPISRPGRGRKLDDFDLVKVAIKYSRLSGQHDVYTTLAQQCVTSKNYARNLVFEARRQGYLAPTRPGKANHELTPKADAFIAEHLGDPRLEMED